VIEITSCSVHSLSVEPPNPSAYVYYINDQATPFFIPFPDYTYQPRNCPDGEDGLDFSLEEDYPWAMITPHGGRSMRISETNIDEEGTYPLTWKVCPAMPSSVGCKTARYSVRLSACRFD
jgi:hypothetical protein